MNEFKELNRKEASLPLSWQAKRGKFSSLAVSHSIFATLPRALKLSRFTDFYLLLQFVVS
jgi:hypothetical protein